MGGDGVGRSLRIAAIWAGVRAACGLPEEIGPGRDYNRPTSGRVRVFAAVDIEVSFACAVTSEAAVMPDGPFCTRRPDAAGRAPCAQADTQVRVCFSFIFEKRGDYLHAHDLIEPVGDRRAGAWVHRYDAPP